MTIFKLSVTLESPLHIGGEVRSNTFAQRPLLKTAFGLPYIPATSIKGRLRHEVERIVHLYYEQQDKVVTCHAPAPEDMCQFESYEDFCPVCKLFGSPWQESALYFEDLKLDETIFADISTVERSGVSINRKRRTAEPQRLYNIELFEPGMPLTFSGELEYLGDGATELAPLFMAARMVNKLGGNRSRGLGWCKIVLTKSTEVEEVGKTELRALWSQWKEMHT